VCIDECISVIDHGITQLSQSIGNERFTQKNKNKKKTGALCQIQNYSAAMDSINYLQHQVAAAAAAKTNKKKRGLDGRG
jgi:hypothetical protein